MPDLADGYNRQGKENEIGGIFQKKAGQLGKTSVKASVDHHAREGVAGQRNQGGESSCRKKTCFLMGKGFYQNIKGQGHKKFDGQRGQCVDRVGGQIRQSRADAAGKEPGAFRHKQAPQKDDAVSDIKVAQRNRYLDEAGDQKNDGGKDCPIA